MRVPVDTSRLKFLVVADAEPLRQFEEGKPREAWAPRTDASGEVLWRVQLVMLGEGEAEIIRVAVPGDPKVAQGEMVAVDGLDGAGVGAARRPLGHVVPGARDPVGGGRARPGRRRRRDGALCVTVPVDLENPPWTTRYLDSDGNPCAWLHLGADGELGALRHARRHAAPRRGRARRRHRARTADAAATTRAGERPRITRRARGGGAP